MFSLWSECDAGPVDIAPTDVGGVATRALNAPNDPSPEVLDAFPQGAEAQLDGAPLGLGGSSNGVRIRIGNTAIGCPEPPRSAPAPRFAEHAGNRAPSSRAGPLRRDQGIS